MTSRSCSSRSSSTPVLLAASALLALIATACSSTPQPPARDARQATAVPPAPVTQPDQVKDWSDARCALPTTYFTYDSALLDDSSREAVVAAVGCFNRQGMPEAFRLQGATDPRGTEEYNLALGHRRAAMVQQLLISLGVAAGRISVTSTGEEAATGRDEAGWRLDRHVAAVER